MKAIYISVRANKDVDTGVCAWPIFVSQPHPERASRAATPRRNSTMCQYHKKNHTNAKEKRDVGLSAHAHA